MTKKEFNDFVRLLRTNYGFNNFLVLTDQLDTWFGSLNQYDYRDAKTAAVRWVENHTHSPALADMVSAIKYARDDRERSEARTKPSKVYSDCPTCRNAGVIFYYKDRDGVRCTRQEYDDQSTEWTKNEKGELVRTRKPKELQRTIYEYCYPCKCERGRDMLPDDYARIYGS